MSNVYLFAVMLLFVPLTGCIELDDTTEDNSSSLEDAFNDFIDSINKDNWRKYCKYFVYTIDDETNTITLANNTELDECAEDMSDDNDSYEYKVTSSNYTEENLDYKAANNSGFVYSVYVIIEECEREDEFEPWDCEKFDLDIEWVKVSGQWIWWNSEFETVESAPIATFWVEEDSNNVYHVEIVKVSKQEDLESFSFYLKDDSGSTYTGHAYAGFGEIAMQIIDGEEKGIDMNYGGDDERLKSRASNVSNDDGSEFPVHFSDNDRDGMLSAGDQFLVYGGDNGPAEDGWKLELHYDPSGDIVGSAKLL